MAKEAISAADNPCDLIPVRLSPRALERYRIELELPDGAATLAALAEAVAGSPDWQDLPPCALAVSGVGMPAIGVFGRFEGEQASWIERQLANLLPSLSRIRYVSWSRAERDCARLAAALGRRLGPEGLRSARFLAVPRGGGAVLAILSYLLDLEPRALVGPEAAGSPLVVVDDCALSGARLRGHLQALDAQGVVFAHLYSHPDLRAALEGAEPRIDCCVAARDLTDFAPSTYGSGYEEWLRERHRRLPGERLWLGVTEHVCFAWGEPERPLWDPASSTLRLGWNLLPASRCLRHRPVRRGNRPTLRARADGSRGLRLAESVLVGELEGRTVVGDLAGEAVLALSPTAGRMLDSLVEHGQAAAAAAALADYWQTDLAELESDVEGLRNDLLERGLLVRGGSDPVASAGAIQALPRGGGTRLPDGPDSCRDNP